MNFKDIFNDKAIKPKQKTEALCQWLLSNPKSLDKLIAFASEAKDPIKATCIETIEFATNANPKIATEACLKFVIETLTENAPRIKWESAKVIGNIAHLYPNKLNEAVKNLLVNSEHSGTVVRWSSAFALGEIIKLKTKLNKDLIPFAEAMIKREEKNSIKKFYIDAIKQKVK
jgi:hypothetical protein